MVDIEWRALVAMCSHGNWRLVGFRSFVGLLCAGFAACPGIATAATATADLHVTIEITSECLLGTVTDVNFGSHGVLSAAQTAQGSISVQCTNNQTYTLALGAGSGAGADANTADSRFMTLASGTDTVSYGLYRDSALAQPWGDATGNLFSGTGTGSAVAIPVYGKVPSQTTPQAGIYNDTVVVTLTY
jgi:spore coat protein U-like protein